MAKILDLEKGEIIKSDNQIWKVVKSENTTFGRGRGHIKLLLKNLKTGNLIKKVFRPEEETEVLELESKPAVFLYKDRKSAVFSVDWERVSFPLEEMGDKIFYLRENEQGQELKILYIEGKPYTVELPIKVTLKVVGSPPYIKGATAVSNSKQVVLESGLKAKVPMFIKEGDIIRLNTETGEYCGRA